MYETSSCFMWDPRILYFYPPFKKRFGSRLVGLFQHCSRRMIVLLPPDEFIHLLRRHATYRRERTLLEKEGTITKEFS